MIRNSTIRQRTGLCEMCAESKGKQPLTKGLCSQHYWLSIRLKSAQKFQEKELQTEDGLPELMQRADEIVSKYVRLSNSIDGFCQCYTCSMVDRWQDMDCGHFIPRSNMHTRYDVTRNLRVQCKGCNQHKRGNIPVFARRLNEERPGLADLLIEESTLIYKPSREELKAIIVEYTQKVNKLKLTA